jgi:hypothetical protein
VVNKARRRIIIISKTINNNISLVQWCISQVLLIINHHRCKIPPVMEHHLNIKTVHHLMVIIPWCKCKEVQVFKETIVAWWDLRKIICHSQINGHLWCKIIKVFWFSRQLVNTELFLNLLWSITTCNHNNNNNKYHVPKLKKKWKTQSTRNQNYKI